MTTLDDLRIAWTALAEAPSPQGHRVATLMLGESVPAGSVLVGRDLDGRRHLLVPAEPEAILEDTSSDAVQIRLLELGAPPAVSSYADVCCRDPDLADVFDDLVLAMLREIDEREGNPPTLCVEVLARWRAFLRPPAREPLSVNQTAGLVAELLVALEIVKKDPDRRVDVWAGPAGARHDFRRGPRAIEVKASTASQGPAGTQIHGLDQLEAPEGGTLCLAWFRLERVADGQLSVARLVEKLRRLVGGSAALYSRLTECGWRPESAAERLCFELRERRAFAVEGEFPRLTPERLVGGAPMPGVVNVRYDVVLEDEPPMSEAEWMQLVETLATGEGG